MRPILESVVSEGAHNSLMWWISFGAVGWVLVSFASALLVGRVVHRGDQEKTLCLLANAAGEPTQRSLQLNANMGNAFG